MHAYAYANTQTADFLSPMCRLVILHICDPRLVGQYIPVCNRFLALPVFFHSECKKTVFLHVMVCKKPVFFHTPVFLHACKNSIFLTPACKKTVYLHSLFEPSKGFGYLRPRGRTCLLLIVGKWQPGCFRKVERPIIVGDVVSLANVSDGTLGE